MGIDTHTLVTPGSGDEYKSQARPAYQPPPNVYGDLVQTALKVGINSYAQLKKEKKQGDLASWEAEKMRANTDYQEELRNAGSESEVNLINKRYESRLGSFISGGDFDSSMKLSMTNNLKKVSAGFYTDGKARMSTVYAKKQMANKAEMMQTVIASGDMDYADEVLGGEGFKSYFNGDEKAYQSASAEVRSLTISSNFNQQTLAPLRQNGVNPEVSEATTLRLMQSIEADSTLKPEHKSELLKSTKMAIKDGEARFTAISNGRFDESMKSMEDAISSGEWNEATKTQLAQQFGSSPYSTVGQRQMFGAMLNAGPIAMNNPFYTEDATDLNKLIVSYGENGMTTSQRSQATIAINLLPNEQDRMIAMNKLEAVPVSADDPVAYKAKRGIDEAIYTGNLLGSNIYADKNAMSDTKYLIGRLPIGASEKKKMYNDLLEGKRAYEKLSIDDTYKGKIEPYIKAIEAPASKYYSALRQLDENDVEKRNELIEKINTIYSESSKIKNSYMNFSNKSDPNMLSAIGLTPAKTAGNSAISGMNTEVSEATNKPLEVKKYKSAIDYRLEAYK